MKKLLSIILSISISMMSMVNVFADEYVDQATIEQEKTDINIGGFSEDENNQQLLDKDELLNDDEPEQESEVIEEIITGKDDFENNTSPEDEILAESETNTEEEKTDEESNPDDVLDEKVNEYLETFPEDSADKQMFLREIELLKFSDSYIEEEVDKVYDRFKPIDISSLPEIEPVEIPDGETEVDESSVIRISEEERERNAEENQRLLNWYEELMEGMTDEEAVELGINEEIIHLVRLRELQNLEESINEAEMTENNMSRPMSAPRHPSSSSNTTSKAPMIASGDYHNVYLKGDGTVWTWGDYNTTVIKPMMDTYTVPTRIEMLTDIIEVSATDDYALALSSSGVVYAWGAYTGTGYGSRDPIIVSGLSDIISIDAGSLKALAVKADGSVYEWTPGTFCARQVMQSANTPLTDIKQVASGVPFLYALKTDGSVVAWRYDAMQNGSYPAVINNVNNIIDISAAYGVFLLLNDEGYVYRSSEEENIVNINPELVMSSNGMPLTNSLNTL